MRAAEEMVARVLSHLDTRDIYTVADSSLAADLQQTVSGRRKTRRTTISESGEASPRVVGVGDLFVYRHIV